MPAKSLLLLLLLFTCSVCHAQTDTATGKLISFPSRLLGKIRSRTAGLDRQLTAQTEKYLQKMQRREEKLRQKLYAADSNAARQLFTGSSQQYAALEEKMAHDTGSSVTRQKGVYTPYMDSLQGALGFLKKNPQMVNAGSPLTGVPGSMSVQAAASQFQTLQAKIQDAGEAQAYIQQRKQQISQYIAQHADIGAMLGKQYAGLNQDVYYYSQQLRQYKEMWDHPGELEQKALQLLNTLPSFQTFMKSNSQLSGLFNLPAGYGSSQALAGLQTRDLVTQQIQRQLSTGGPGASAALESDMQSAQAGLDGYKDKLSRLGAGNGDMDIPDFRPNDQKTKTFWKRLQYGTNFQTTHTNYYFPMVTDLGISLGYRLTHSNVVGVGASYKLGWGNGIQHIALSSQGLGLRSFLEIKVKSSWSATGGWEYNYTTPFSSFQQLKQIERWTQSGLIGISKTVSVKNRMFKSTKLQLLWDLLSYQQVPKTQPILFRIGYTFN